MIGLLDTYRSILYYSGCRVNDNENCRIFAQLDSNSGTQALTLNGGRPWVLPTQENLKTAYDNNFAIFHPLNENIIKGESADVKRLRSCLLIHINYSLYTLIVAMLHIASSPELHATISPEQTDMCVKVKKITKEQKNLFEKLAWDAINRADGIYQLVYINLSRGSTLGDKKFSRVGNVTFPFFEKLKEGVEICGKKLNQADTKAFIRMFEYVFPELDKEGKYSFGSNSTVAPYLEALLKSSYNIVERILELYNNFENVLTDPIVFEFDLKWLEVFEDLKAYEPEIRKVCVTQSSSDYADSIAAKQAPPQEQAQPNIKVTSNGIDPSSLFQSLNNRNFGVNNNNRGFVTNNQRPLISASSQAYNQRPLNSNPDWAIPNNQNNGWGNNQNNGWGNTNQGWTNQNNGWGNNTNNGWNNNQNNTGWGYQNNNQNNGWANNQNNQNNGWANNNNQVGWNLSNAKVSR